MCGKKIEKILVKRSKNNSFGFSYLIFGLFDNEVFSYMYLQYSQKIR